jgi:hypothetical protein
MNPLTLHLHRSHVSCITSKCRIHLSLAHCATTLPCAATMPAKGGLPYSPMPPAPPCHRASSSLQLLVDKSVPGNSACPAPSLALFSVKLAGEGLPCTASLEPACLTVPGTLHPQQQHVQHLQITNTCGAEACFTWSVLPDPAETQPPAAAVEIQPQQGVIPAGGSCSVAVIVTAVAAGQLHRRLQCQVEHGPRLVAELVAAVQPPDVEVVATGGRLDFGIVRGGGGSRHLKLHIRNTSGSAESSFQLSQLAAAAAAAAAGTEGSGGGGGKQEGGGGALLAFEPAAGTIAAGGQVEVRVTCTGGSCEGLQHMLVACSSGGGRRLLLPASALVALPRLVVSRQVVATGDLFLGVDHCEEVVVVNSGLLPCQYQWCALPAGGADAAAGAGRQQEQPQQEGQAEVVVEPATGVLQPGGCCAAATCGCCC